MLEYIRHSELCKHLDAALKVREALISRKNEIMASVLPKSVDLSKDRVKTSAVNNPFAEYIETLERNGIDEKTIAENKAIVFELIEMIELSERKLRKSNNIYDKFYILKVVEKRPLWQIEKRLNYSHAQAWRKWQIIKKNL